MQSPSNGGWFKVIYILSFKHVNVIEKIILWQHHLAVLVTNNSWLHISSISCSALYTLFLTSPVLGLAGSLCCMSVSVSACVSVTIFSTSYRVGNQVFLGVGLWEFFFYRAGLLGLYWPVPYYSIYRCTIHLYVAINISIRYGSEWVTFCCSYLFCHKIVTNGQILVIEGSLEIY